MPDQHKTRFFIMLYLLLAIVSSTLINVFMRLSEDHAENRTAMLAVNYLTCASLAYLFSKTGALFPASDGFSGVLLIGIVSGVMYLASFLMLKWNISKNGVVLPATFMKLGVLVPTIISILFYGEKLTLPRGAGFALALLAIVFLNEKNTQKRESTWGLVLLLLMGGFTDFTGKIFEEHCPAALSDHYLLFTFASALILCALLCLFKKERLTYKDLFFGVLIGCPNYFSSRFLLLALGSLDAVVVFPTFSVGTILLVAVAGKLLFKEHLSKRKLTCLSIILVSLAFLNL